MLAILVGTADAQTPPPGLQWQVEQRFRLFGEAPMDDLLDQISTRGLRASHDAIVARISGGWDELLPELQKAYDASGSSTQGRSGLYNREYLRPKSLRISASATGLTGACTWTIDGQPGVSIEGHALVDVPCEQPQRFLVTEKNGEFLSYVEVRSADGRMIPKTALHIDHEIIVGLGDSYASGEGNPDVPSRLELPPPPPIGPQRKHAETADWYDKVIALNPNTGPTWFDPACRRSLINNHVLGALAYSANHPHKAVTLVALACSGASVFDGLLTSKLDKNNRVVSPPQVGQLLDLICQHDDTREYYEPMMIGMVGRRRSMPRNRYLEPLSICQHPELTINKVLISIGGNDIGFGGLITWAVLPARGWGDLASDLGMAYFNASVGLVCPYNTEARCRKAPVARDNIEDLPDVYAELQHVFGKIGIAPSQVMLTAYPNPLLSGSADSTGRAYHCPLYRRYEFDRSKAPNLSDYLGYQDGEPIIVTPGLDAIMAGLPVGFRGWQTWLKMEESVQIEAHVMELLEPTMRRSASHLGWRFVDRHLGESNQHGWCALDWPPDGEHRLYVLGPLSQAELTYPENLGGLAPVYTSRNRWFRTINDSFLTQAKITDGRVNDSTWSGAFHPTSDLHVVMGEAIADALSAPPDHMAH
ncbi:hypothetical protein [Phenylobacterium sp.]|uniref:hypothetical protein n=1 Tax=Phenylobacterium sp. TaxID=1871053 RepID=UPI00261D1850|nr:hypothetical protein [Phenylobacterium sp.]